MMRVIIIGSGITIATIITTTMMVIIIGSGGSSSSTTTTNLRVRPAAAGFASATPRFRKCTAIF